jgi:DivIVA domain-containing protein
VLRTVRRGYERRAVQELLSRCVLSLGDRAAEFPELAEVRPPDGPAARVDARDVRDARFPIVLRGYDIAQVDALLERVARALPGEDARPAWDAVGPAGDAADHPELVLRRAVRGYDVQEVDAFLSRCAHSLGARVDRVPELAGLLDRPRTGSPLRARDVELARFRIKTRGYDMQQVDLLLDRILTALDDGADRPAGRPASPGVG